MTALHLKARAPHRSEHGDVHVGSMAGDVPPAPGSTTETGRQAVQKLMQEVLAEVRRHISRRDRLDDQQPQ